MNPAADAAGFFIDSNSNDGDISVNTDLLAIMPMKPPLGYKDRSLATSPEATPGSFYSFVFDRELLAYSIL